MKWAMRRQAPSLSRIYDRALKLFLQQSFYLRITDNNGIKPSAPLENDVYPRQRAVSNNPNIYT
jgi:hypothetical protein